MSAADGSVRNLEALNPANMVRIACCVLILAVPAVACTCPAGIGTSREDAAERVNSAGPKTVILEGIVESQELSSGPIGAPNGALSMTSYGQHRLVTIRSVRAYRGPGQERFMVVTGVGGGDCGFDFETQEKYLVFAEKTGPGLFFTSICSGTAWQPHAGAALRLLRGEPPAPEDLMKRDEVYARWTASVCGRVLRADGQPLPHANVYLSRLRKDGFPPETVGDPNLSQADGSFCIRTIFPGGYLLGAEDTDFKSSTRWIGFYPGVAQRASAMPLNVVAGKNMSDLQFIVQREPLYTVRIRVVTADRSPLPGKNLGVEIASPNRDPNEYHSSGRMNDNTSLVFSYVPAGLYRVSSYFLPVFSTDPPSMPAEASKWKPETREVEITEDREVSLTLTPMK